jgi:hypothetical protein
LNVSTMTSSIHLKLKLKLYGSEPDYCGMCRGCPF